MNENLPESAVNAIPKAATLKELAAPSLLDALREELNRATLAYVVEMVSERLRELAHPDTTKGELRFDLRHFQLNNQGLTSLMSYFEAAGYTPSLEIDRDPDKKRMLVLSW